MQASKVDLEIPKVDASGRIVLMLELLEDRLLIKRTYESDSANAPFLALPPSKQITVVIDMESDGRLPSRSYESGLSQFRSAVPGPPPLVFYFCEIFRSHVDRTVRFTTPEGLASNHSFLSFAARSPAAHQSSRPHCVQRPVSPRDCLLARSFDVSSSTSTNETLLHPH